jgi:DNA-binding transcriptional MerR regulator
MPEPSPTWLTAPDLADRLGVPVRTLRYWRAKGRGPRPSYLGRRVRYATPDVLAWEAEARASSST